MSRTFRKKGLKSGFDKKHYVDDWLVFNEHRKYFYIPYKGNIEYNKLINNLEFYKNYLSAKYHSDTKTKNGCPKSFRQYLNKSLRNSNCLELKNCIKNNYEDCIFTPFKRNVRYLYF